MEAPNELHRKEEWRERWEEVYTHKGYSWSYRTDVRGSEVLWKNCRTMTEALGRHGLCYVTSLGFPGSRLQLETKWGSHHRELGA